jgi:hypothetical protein
MIVAQSNISHPLSSYMQSLNLDLYMLVLSLTLSANINDLLFYIWSVYIIWMH